MCSKAEYQRKLYEGQHPTTYLKILPNGQPFLYDKWERDWPKYRKVANQYGVCKFVRVK